MSDEDEANAEALHQAAHEPALQAVDPRDATIARLSAQVEAAREALAPFAKFAEKAEAFVESRAGAANDASGIMAPTKDFRLADFVRARAALAKLSEGT